jgi:hypothetical protein
MKTRASKTPAVQAKKNDAFFGKEGKGAFFGQQASKEQFFGGRAGDGGVIQPKLTVGQPNDVYEKEADATADKVLQKKPIFESEADPAPEAIRRKETSSNMPGVTPSVESGLRGSRGGGSPLPAATRKQMESGIGADFSGVRIHNDSSAKKMSKDLNAQAFTHGKDIYFNSGKYDPASTSGKHLLAHELTHVVQQNKGVSRKPAISKKAAGPNAPAPAAGSPQAAAGSAPAAAGKTAEVKKIEIPEEQKAPEEMEAERGGKDMQSPIRRMPMVQKALTTGGTDIATMDQAAIAAVGKAKEGYVEKEGGTKDGKIQIRFDDLLTKQYASVFIQKDKSGVESIAAPPYTKPTTKRKTKQGYVWKRDAGPVVKDTLSDIIARKKVQGPNYVLTVKKSPKVGVTGTVDQIALQVAVPFWGMDGLPVKYQIEHKIDWQIAGGSHDVDVISNLLLLNAAENQRIGEVVLVTMQQYYQNIIAFYKAKGVTGLDDSFEAGKGLYKILTNSIKSDPQSVSGSIISVSNMNKTATQTPFSDTLIDVAQEDLKGKLALHTAKDGAGNIVDYNFSNKFIEIKGDANKHRLDSITLKGVKDKKSNLKGAKIDKPLQFSPFNGLQDHFKVEAEGYAGELKDMIREMKFLSPITWTEVGFDPFTGWTASATVKPEVSFLENAEVSITLDGDVFTIDGVVTSEALQGKLPKPFHLDYCSLTFSASSDAKFSIGGELGFSIDGYGKGHVGGKVLNDGLQLFGGFDFDKGNFTGSLDVKYTKTGDKGSWYINGKVALNKGFKGVKSLSVGFTSDEDGTVTGKGSAELSIPGVEKIDITATVGEGKMTIGADFQLSKLPKLEGGSGHIELTKTGNDWDIALTGTVKPKLNIPFLTITEVGISYQKGVFDVNATATFKRGGVSGTIHVGLTNNPVTAEGKKADGDGGKALSFYADGQINVDIMEGVGSQIDIKMTPDGDILLDGKITLTEDKQIFPEKDFDQPLFPDFHAEIPLASCIVVTLSLTISGAVHIYAHLKPLAIDHSSYIGLSNVSLKNFSNPKIDAHLVLTSHLDAGVLFTIGVGLQADLLKVIKGEVKGQGSLDFRALDADARATLDAGWSSEQGIQLKNGEIEFDLLSKLIATLSAVAQVYADLYVTQIPIWSHKWDLATKIIPIKLFGDGKLKFPLPIGQDGKIGMTEETLNGGIGQLRGQVSQDSLSEKSKDMLNGNGDTLEDHQAETPALIKQKIMEEFTNPIRFEFNKSVDYLNTRYKMLNSLRERAKHDDKVDLSYMEEDIKKCEFEEYERFGPYLEKETFDANTKYLLIDDFMRNHPTLGAAEKVNLRSLVVPDKKNDAVQKKAIDSSPVPQVQRAPAGTANQPGTAGGAGKAGEPGKAGSAPSAAAPVVDVKDWKVPNADVPVHADIVIDIKIHVPEDDPYPDFSSTSHELNSWENAFWNPGEPEVMIQCEQTFKEGMEWSYVREIHLKAETELIYQIARHIQEKAAIGKPTQDDQEGEAFQEILKRVVKHSKEHFARYRQTAREAEKLFRARLATLPGKNSPVNLSMSELKSYVENLIKYLWSILQHRVWQVTSELETRDYPGLLKGVRYVEKAAHIPVKKIPEPRIKEEPFLPAVVKSQVKTTPVIQLDAETDATGNYTGNYIFDPGHGGLNAGFFNKVKKDVADGVLDDDEIKALRKDALDRNGTVEHAELLLMAAMRNPVNVTKMKAYKSGKLIIPMSDIKQADRDYLTNFGVEKNPLDPAAYFVRGLAALLGLSKEKLSDVVDEYDNKAMELIHKYAGKQFSDQADALIVFCEDNPVLPWKEVIDAMLNGASDSTEGDRIMAGTVYAIAKNAGHAMAPKILSGEIKIDALVPSVFHRIAGDAEAIYQYSTDTDVLKADTVYIQTDLNIFSLTSQALVIHELTHAADDFAAAGPASKSEDSLKLETHAYKEEGKYMMDQILASPTSIGYVDAAAKYVHGSDLYYWSMVAAAKDDVTKYEATLVSICTHAPNTKTAVAVKADLALSAADLETKVRTALVAYRTSKGKQLYKPGPTTIGGTGGHYFVQRSCDPDKQSCMPEAPAVDDPLHQMCYVEGQGPVSKMSGGDLISSLFGLPVQQGPTGTDAAGSGIPTVSGDETQLLLQTEYKPTLDLLITRHSDAEAALKRNDEQLFHADVGIGGFGFGIRPNTNLTGSVGSRTGLLVEFNDSKQALDDTLQLVGLSDPAAVAGIGDKFIDMVRSKAREVANFMLDQSEAIATAEYQRYSALPFESSLEMVNDLRQSTQRLGNIQHDFIQVLNFVADEFAETQGFWGIGGHGKIDEDNYTDYLGGSVLGGSARVQRELQHFRKAIEEEGLKFPVLMKEKLNYVELGYHTSDAELIQSAMGIALKTLDDIKKSREKIDDDNIWDLNPVIEATAALFHLTPKSYAFVYLQEYLQRRNRNKGILDIFLSAVGIILSLVAIFASGGLAIFAIVGGAALGGVQTYRHIKRYQFEKAARGSSLDLNQSIGRDFDPSALSLAFDVAMTFVSFLQAAKAVRGLGAAVNAAEQTGVALERVGVNARSMGFGANVQRFAASKGYNVEQVSEDTYRITHAEMEGEYILTRQSIRYQTPTGTGGMRTEFEVPFNAEGSEPQGLLPPGQKALPPGSPAVRPPRPQAPRVQVGEADLDAMRLQYNIPQNARTIGIGRTDVEGLAGRPFYGGSRTIRAYAAIPDSAPHIYSPRTMYLAIDHAEQDIANDFIDAVEAAGLKAEALEGKTLAMHISHPRGPCFACLQGEAGSGVDPGVLFNLSNRYPGLTIRITWLDAQGNLQGLVIVGGARY